MPEVCGLCRFSQGKRRELGEESEKNIVQDNLKEMHKKFSITLI